MLPLLFRPRPSVLLGSTCWLLAFAVGCGDEEYPDVGVTDLGVREDGGADGGSGDLGPSDLGSPDSGTADSGNDAGVDVGPICVAEPAPVHFEVLPGFTQSEDFQFDAQGRVVSGDAEGNLVRTTRDGQRTLFVPNAGAGGAGMRFLSNGDLVYAKVEDGTIYRVTPNGGVTPVLSGLEYPNGMEVDLDDQIYVSEQSGGRVRKIDPQTGQFEIVARGLYNPNGLSFSPDYRRLYCGSFGGGAIYAIPFDEAGAPLAPTVFAETPNAPGVPEPEGPSEVSVAACLGRAEGEACGLPINGTLAPGSCYRLGQVLYCETPGNLADPYFAACVGLAVNQDCVVQTDGGPAAGLCLDFDGLLYCGADPSIVACRGLALGAPCTLSLGAGICVDAGGYTYCQQLSPPEIACLGLGRGDPCVIRWPSGAEVAATCAAEIFAPPVCTPPLPYVAACRGQSEGAPCTWTSAAGTPHRSTCRDYQGSLSCGFDPNASPFAEACVGLTVNATCATDWYGATWPGTCDGEYCNPEVDRVTPCLGQVEGSTCALDYLGTLYPDHCQAEEGGLACGQAGLGRSGGLDGLGVDACGNVYVTEYELGKVWRISPDASTIEPLMESVSAWIPNIHWGNGVGGFDRDKAYIADRVDGALYEVFVGVEEKPRRSP